MCWTSNWMHLWSRGGGGCTGGPKIVDENLFKTYRQVVASHVMYMTCTKIEKTLNIGDSAATTTIWTLKRTTKWKMKRRTYPRTHKIYLWILEHQVYIVCSVAVSFQRIEAVLTHVKCSPGIVMIVNSDFSKFGPCFFYIHYLTVFNEDRLIARAEVWTQTPTQEPTLQGTGSFPPPLMMTQAQIGESVASVRGLYL